MADEKKVKYDLDGFDIVTNALMNVVNQYPDLQGDKIAFSTIGEDGGIAIFPTSGAVVETERRSVTGKVAQNCNYPFFIIYKVSGVSENSKIAVKEFLDKMGRWLERQAVIIGTDSYLLEEYPKLTENREITDISRVTPAYLESIEENKAENWAISMVLKYKNEFYSN